ncbi:hypothetical protein F5Y10DRAFT_268525 [Nemania abortiva]|nr:hypothetical protein F5Y10DRAFT_268525 [Nemania abortiva]
MFGRGDIGLARELQAEFGRAKEPRRRGRRGGGGGPARLHTPAEQQYQFNRRDENAALQRRRGRYQARREALPATSSYRPPFRGQLYAFHNMPHYINNVSYLNSGNSRISSHAAEADMFFPRPQASLPPIPPPSTQTSTDAITNTRQPSGQVSIRSFVPYTSNSDNINGVGALRLPLNQTTNQLSTKVHHDTIPSSFMITATQESEPARTTRVEDKEDIQMGGVNYPSATTLKPRTTNHSRGLAGSMWNPANENATLYSADSNQARNEPDNLTITDYRMTHGTFMQASLKPRSNTSASTKEVETVTSGISKGPGLAASR